MLLRGEISPFCFNDRFRIFFSFDVASKMEGDRGGDFKQFSSLGSFFEKIDF